MRGSVKPCLLRLALGAMGRATFRFATVALAVLAVGCASSVRRVDGAFRHVRHGYTIAAPAPDWKAVDVDHATLTFVRGRSETMSLKSRCGRPVAKAELMARHLLIGLDPRDVVTSEPIRVDGRAGWLQVVRTESQGRDVWLRTVTLVEGECSFDWVLATSVRPGPVEAEFDAWWESFRLEDSSAGDTDS